MNEKTDIKETVQLFFCGYSSWSHKMAFNMKNCAMFSGTRRSKYMKRLNFIEISIFISDYLWLNWQYWFYFSSDIAIPLFFLFCEVSYSWLLLGDGKGSCLFKRFFTCITWTSTKGWSIMYMEFWNYQNWCFQ